MKINPHFVLLILLFISSQMHAQKHKKKLRIGFNYGIGKQEMVPFDNKNYLYHVYFYKAQIGRKISDFGKFNFEMLLEPGVYKATHQLLNKWFIQPDRWDDYLELREKYVQERTYYEYVITIGALIRFNLANKWSMYILGSTGPAYNSEETERLAQGFAFSSNVGIGISYQMKDLIFEIRPSLRHLSNADTQFPNIGHNSTNIELGISF